MADGHGRDTPLGDRRFAWIGNNERIDYGQRAGDNFGKTITGKRDRLARQPFQRAVRAHMHDGMRICDPLHPRTESD
ncbi:hypothetical protein D3C78_1640640 [compost metagenome]